MARNPTHAGPGPVDLMAEAERLTSLLTAARRHIVDGRLVNLQALQTRTAALVERVMALPPVEARRLQPVLAGLIRHLDDLMATLGDRLDHLGQRMGTPGGDGADQRAASARYAQTMTRDLVGSDVLGRDGNEKTGGGGI